jgi:hypothetical protein
MRGIKGRDRRAAAVSEILTPIEPTKGIQLLPQFDWHRIYSTNFDLLVVAVSRGPRATTDQMAKIDGLHAPIRQEVNVTLRQSAAAILDRAERELLELVDKRERVGDVIDAEVVT